MGLFKRSGEPLTDEQLDEEIVRARCSINMIEKRIAGFNISARQKRLAELEDERRTRAERKSFRVRPAETAVTHPARTEMWLQELENGTVCLVARGVDDHGALPTGILDITPEGEIMLLGAQYGDKTALGFRTHCHGAIRVINGVWRTR